MHGVSVGEIEAAYDGFRLGKYAGWMQATGFWGIVFALVALFACLK